MQEEDKDLRVLDHAEMQALIAAHGVHPILPTVSSTGESSGSATRHLETMPEPAVSALIGHVRTRVWADQV